jgi:hypothetical protein
VRGQPPHIQKRDAVERNRHARPDGSCGDGRWSEDAMGNRVASIALTVADIGSPRAH